MDTNSFTISFLLIFVGRISTQEQPGLANLLTTLVGDNKAAPVLQQGPEIATNFAGLLNYLNTTGNITGVINTLSADQQIPSLASTLLTLLFESLSLTVLTNNRVSDACQTDLIIFIEELLRGNPWALRMLDATGKPGSDLSDGLTKFVGSYEECVGIHATSYFPDSNGHGRERASFRGKYCSVTAELPGVPPQYLDNGAGYIQIGVCVPHTCTHGDVEILSSMVERLLFNNTVPLLPTAHCQEGKAGFGTDFIVVIGILTIISSMVLIGTLYDITKSHFTLTVTEKRVNKFNETGVEDGKTSEMDRDLSQKDVVEALHDIFGSPDKFGRTVKSSPKQPIGKLFLAFSLYTNGKKLLRTDQSGSLGALNGIRFLSQAWIILSHSAYFAKRYDTNLAPAVLQRLTGFTNMAIASGAVAVDTFFVLTGVMVAYLTLKKIQTVGSPKKINWAKFYFHRYLRLTPLYMFVLMIGTVILPYTMFGPFWDYNNMAYMEPCRKNWWTNLLYINNYVNLDNMCMEWSWYLPNDMQFYWISPLLIVPLFYNLAAGLAICFSLLIAGAAIVGTLAHYHQYPAQRYSFQYIPLDEQQLDDDENRYIYKISYACAGPFIVGVLAGYLLYRCKCKLRIPKLLNLAGWVISIGITMAVVYGPYTNKDSHIMSRLESDLYLSLNKPAWGLAVGWIIVSCATGNGGWINRVLSWKPFLPLSRLTYCVYLIHPLVMVTFYSSRMVTMYFTDYELIYLFLGHLTLSYGLAFVVSLVFEFPWMALEKAFLGAHNSD